MASGCGRWRDSGEAPIKKFTTKRRVYWSDCDSAGILYFGNFFRFMEVAEEELFYSLGHPRVDIYSSLHFGLPRAEVWCRYLKPARQGDLMEITIWIERRTEKSLLFHFEMRREGDTELAAEARYAVVCVDLRQFRPIPLPAEIIKLLRDYLPPKTARAASLHSK